MTDYKCGHKVDMIITDNSPLTISAYLVWKDSNGFDGDKSLCWECWNKKLDKERIVERLTRG